jgi:hypothetical protein
MKHASHFVTCQTMSLTTRFINRTRSSAASYRNQCTVWYKCRPTQCIVLSNDIDTAHTVAILTQDDIYPAVRPFLAKSKDVLNLTTRCTTVASPYRERYYIISSEDCVGQHS